MNTPAAIFLFDKTGNMAKPWADAGNLCYCVDIQHPKGESLGGLGAVVHPLRVAVSGIAEGPGLFEMLVLIGRERVCARLRKAARTAG